MKIIIKMTKDVDTDNEREATLEICNENNKDEIDINFDGKPGYSMYISDLKEVVDFFYALSQ